MSSGAASGAQHIAHKKLAVGVHTFKIVPNFFLGDRCDRMNIQGPPKTIQRRFLVIMKLSKHKNGHYGSRKIKWLSLGS